jgi:hypothetical protein
MTDKVREDRLRRMAQRQGLFLWKSRARDPKSLTFGLFEVRKNNNVCAKGTLDQVEKFLQQPDAAAEPEVPAVTKPNAGTNGPNGKLSKGEQTHLFQLFRQRTKVMRTEADARGAALLADLESQLAKIYHYDEDATWEAVTKDTAAFVEQGQAKIAERCAELGIPKEFAPSISFSWSGRGENAVKERRNEIRRVGQAKVEEQVRSAYNATERAQLNAMQQVIEAGHLSDAAKAFLDNLTPIDEEMKALDFHELEAEVEAEAAKRRRLRYNPYDN